MLNKRYIKSIKRDIFVLISFSIFLFQFLFCYILESQGNKSFKRNFIVLISFLIFFVSISFLVNIGKEMSLPGFRTTVYVILALATHHHNIERETCFGRSVCRIK